MNKRNILILLAVLLAAAAIVAGFIVKARTGGNDSAAEIPGGGQVQTVPELATEPVAAETTTVPSDVKTDNSGNYEPPAAREPEAAESVPGDTSTLAGLSCVLTAQKSSADDSISTDFYPQDPGRFTVQEKTAGSWRSISEDIYYTGSGGLAAATMPPGADSMTLRLLQVQNGSYVAISKEFNVSRQEVMAAGGIMTYQ